MDPRVYWVGFNLVKGIGAVRFQTLLDYFGDPQLAWQAPADALRAAGLSQKIVENLVRIRQDIDLDRYWAHISSQGIHVITWLDDQYPRHLKEIAQPPPVLYIRGSLIVEDDWSVAVVGTRRMTSYGKQIADELASYLGHNNITVVSGMARGVDAIAHDAALRSGGRTVAILGSGVDLIYPPEHSRLAERIIAHGALMSDYPPGTEPDGANFPARNRIISGMSLATVVIEAGETSGALLTATFAAEQGREVFALPGNITAPQSKGTNRLIQQGAHPLLKMEEVLEVLNLQQVQEYRTARIQLPSNAIEASLFGVLGLEPLHIDEIRTRTGLPIAEVSATLTLMELKGMVRQVGGMKYVILREQQGDYRVGLDE